MKPGDLIKYTSVGVTGKFTQYGFIVTIDHSSFPGRIKVCREERVGVLWDHGRLEYPNLKYGEWSVVQ